MKIIKCNTLSEFTTTINLWCEKKLGPIDHPRVFLPAGSTLIPLYQLWETNKPDFTREARFCQVDEVLSEPKSGLFNLFFKQHLPSFQKQMLDFSSLQKNMDLAILGLGTNGHIAFHEPHIKLDFSFGEVTLSDETCENLDIPYSSKGLSYGLQSFLDCKKILLVVRGKSKSNILKKVLSKDPSLPASHLLDHPDFTLITDTQSLPE